MDYLGCSLLEASHLGLRQSERSWVATARFSSPTRHLGGSNYIDQGLTSVEGRLAFCASTIRMRRIHPPPDNIIQALAIAVAWPRVVIWDGRTHLDAWETVFG